MKMHVIKSAVALIITSIVLISCVREVEEPNKISELSGPYLGQVPPGDTPQLFAPGVVSTPLYTRDIAMTPDGNEIYFCVSALGYNLIFYTEQQNGKWTEPRVAPFIKNLEFMYYEPHITQDGKKMLFLSNMLDKDSVKGDQDIWAVDRINDSWGEPYNLGAPVNSDGAEFYPSVTKSGTIYFTRQPTGDPNNYIYRSKMVDGKYSEVEKLPLQVNCGEARYNAFIDPDERFIIVPTVGMKDGYGGTDYYIVFRNKNDNWSNPINMGDKLNTESGREYSSYLSPDGKYLFFMSGRTLPDTNITASNLKLNYLVEKFNQPQNGNSDIYWIDASFIEKLRPEGF